MLLQEWVGTVGQQAGLTAQNTRLSSGCLGVPESRLEMEVTFDSMAQWESFLAAIPMTEHRNWTQRMQQLVVDGSPVWQVHRSVPLGDWQPGSKAAHMPPRESDALRDLNGNQLQRDSWESRQQGEQAHDGGSRQNFEQQLAITDQIGAEDIATWNRFKNQQPPKQQQHGEVVPAVPSTPAAAGEAAEDNDVPRDWKGEPMKINPGDKLPFKFL